MEIQSLSAGVPQARIQEEAAVSVQAAALQEQRNSGENLTRIMESAPPPPAMTDPTTGTLLDMTV